ncbi:MAG: UDP-N-acetylglucosamine--N-acetylmuramyl-(pentapeptide) pyrophosphoryl-undecaprenol N-acetylglucosamine transferase [Candidatus Saccharimonadales bacterium]
MKIILTGGGTGGHITPLLAVAHELKRSEPTCHIVYIGERNGKYFDMLDSNEDIDEYRSVFAGKIRRYHGESWITRILDLKTNLLNLRDVLFTIIGMFQAVFMIKDLNPDVIFLKGGFVGVPIGLAGALWRKRLVTHDSDAIPGLANRVVSRWVGTHAVAMDPETYSYPKDKTTKVGVLVGPNYQFVGRDLKRAYREELGLALDSQVLMITGGSNGSAKINKEIADYCEEFLNKLPNLVIVHQTGRGKLGVYGGYSHQRLRTFGLLKDMYKWSGAADLIVTRAGANTIAEFGVQSKTCIVVPNPLLTGGHQLKNADVLQKNNAAIVVDELSFGQRPSVLWQNIEELLEKSHEKSNQLSKNLHALTTKDAAHRLAKLLLEK